MKWHECSTWNTCRCLVSYPVLAGVLGQTPERIPSAYKSGDDRNKLVADWLNPVQISSMEFDSKLACACAHVQETADCVIWLQSANQYHCTSEYGIRVS